MGVTEERLRLLSLPAFDTESELAALLNVDESQIRGLVQRNDYYYRRITMKKKSGGTRIIHSPSKTMKAVQSWILRCILDKIEPHSAATGFRKGYGIHHNSLPHKSNRYFAVFDIKDFFPSIGFHKIFHLFHMLGYSRNAARILSNLCTCESRLPQGGVTSPALSNLVTRRLDIRLTGLANAKNLVYTRYADDLTFSSNNRNILKNLTSFIIEIIEAEGFSINEKKFRVMGPRIHCEVTGLVKNSSVPKFSIGKRKKVEMRAVMHAFVTGRKINTKYESKNSIEGWLAYVKSVDTDSYLQMLNYWRRMESKYPEASAG